jgi:hypothetical protein
MGAKDIISKNIFKTLVRDFATYLFGLPVTEVELLETANQRIEERRADLLYSRPPQTEHPCPLSLWERVGVRADQKFSLWRSQV